MSFTNLSYSTPPEFAGGTRFFTVGYLELRVDLITFASELPLTS